MRPAIYRGDLGELLAKHMGQFAGRDQECAALVQSVTDVGHTSHWQAGGKVVDQKFITPRTIIANFVFAGGRARYPNRSGWHVAIFLNFGNKDAKGNYTNIWVLDQWRRSPVARRAKKAYSQEDASRLKIRASNNANEYYIVNVP